LSGYGLGKSNDGENEKKAESERRLLKPQPEMPAAYRHERPQTTIQKAGEQTEKPPEAKVPYQDTVIIRTFQEQMARWTRRHFPGN
jgi:hypothetical protein